MEEKVTCPCCGSVVPKARFCSECGYLFDKEMEVKIRSKTRSPQILGIINQPDIPEPVEEGTVPENKLPMPEEEGFSLLVDCCRRTLATVGGDGYDELVLYEKNGIYQIHYLSNYEYMNGAVHTAFATTKECADAVFKAISDEKLARYKDCKGMPLCGGENVVKFVIDGEVYRISEANLPFEKHSSLTRIRKVLSSFINEDNKIDA